MELFKDKHPYPSTVFSTEKHNSNKNIINIETKNNDDLENNINNTFLQSSLFISKEGDYKKILLSIISTLNKLNVSEPVHTDRTHVTMNQNEHIIEENII